MEKELSPSRQVAIKTFTKALELLKSAGGEMSRKELIDRLESSLEFTDWENELMQSNGQKRWKTIFLFYSVGCIKAGFLIKNKGTWVLTAEGEAEMKNGAKRFLEKAGVGYRKWAELNKKTKEPDTIGEETQVTNLELLENQAYDGIISYLNNKNPYEFQDLVAALLEAMGYHTDFIAERGRDGGIDIIAYQDPLGIKTPRIKVQVKHYPKTPISPDPIRSLKGLLNVGEEVGLFVTSGTFSSESRRFARESSGHIKLIDGEELIELWIEHYDNLDDDDKNLLPLYPIYFLGGIE
jgi:restriction system protein